MDAPLARLGPGLRYPTRWVARLFARLGSLAASTSPPVLICWTQIKERRRQPFLCPVLVF